MHGSLVEILFGILRKPVSIDVRKNPEEVIVFDPVCSQTAVVFQNCSTPGCDNRCPVQQAPHQWFGAYPSTSEIRVYSVDRLS